MPCLKHNKRQHRLQAKRSANSWAAQPPAQPKWGSAVRGLTDWWWTASLNLIRNNPQIIQHILIFASNNNLFHLQNKKMKLGFQIESSKTTNKTFKATYKRSTPFLEPLTSWKLKIIARILKVNKNLGINWNQETLKERSLN